MAIKRHIFWLHIIYKLKRVSHARATRGFYAQAQANAHITLYPAVPMTIQRIANIERAQMLVECASRVVLQRFLAGWQTTLLETRRQAEFKSLVRWAIDVDPLAI